MLTLKQIAEHLAPLYGLEVASVHTKLRNPQIVRLLTPAKVGEGRTSAAYYGVTELMRASLFLGLMDLGLLSAEIEAVSRELNRHVSPRSTKGKFTHPESAQTEGGSGYNYLDGLSTIIRGTQIGEDWRIRLVIKRTASGKRKVSSYVAWSKWEGSDRALRISASLDGDIVLGTEKLFASDLIKPFLPLLKG